MHTLSFPVLLLLHADRTARSPCCPDDTEYAPLIHILPISNAICVARPALPLSQPLRCHAPVPHRQWK